MSEILQLKKSLWKLSLRTYDFTPDAMGIALQDLSNEAAIVADKIQSLEAENARLREALEDISKGALQVPDFESYVKSKARIALGGTQ